MPSIGDCLRGWPELHVVHVVRPESFVDRMEEPTGSVGTVDRSRAEAAHWQLEHMCDAMAQRSSTRVVVHTPVGRSAEELKPSGFRWARNPAR